MSDVKWAIGVTFGPTCPGGFPELRGRLYRETERFYNAISRDGYAQPGDTYTFEFSVTCGGVDSTSAPAKARPSREQIEAARSDKGGFTREALEGLGVPWPPPKGWKKALESEADNNNLRLSGEPALRALKRSLGETP